MFCHKCGHQLPDDAEFCSKCGTPVLKDEPPKPPPPQEDRHFRTSEKAPESKGGLSCPHCHSTKLSPINDTEVTVSRDGYGFLKGCCGWIIFGPLGLLCGMCGRGKTTSTKVRHFWCCQSCGYKFRDPTEEYHEIMDSLSGMAVFSTLVLIASFIFRSRDIHFLWLPYWVYMVAGILGIVASLAASTYVMIERKKR